MSERLQMTAFITPKPGKADQLRARLREVVDLTVKEPGCIEFQVFEELENPGHFILWEIFESQDALREHINMEYTRAYFASGLIESTRVMKLKQF
ncbi:MAG: putative quinol monooxygenase [Myxococcota bacterium]